MPNPETVLIVGADGSYCGNCGGEADWREATHESVPPRSASGCGARVTTIRADRPDVPAVVQATLGEMRPDLMLAEREG